MKRILFFTLIIIIFNAINSEAQLIVKSFNVPGTNYGVSIVQTPDSGFAVLATTYSPSTNYDIWLLRMDRNGDTLWTKKYGGSESDKANYMCIMPDGGFLMAGYTNSFGTGTPTYFNWYLVRTNAMGDTLWTWHNNNSLNNDMLYHVLPTSDGGYLLSGFLGSGYAHGRAIKLDSSRNTLWVRAMGGTGNSSVKFAYEEDSAYIVTGKTFYNTYNIKINRYSLSGNFIQSKTYDSKNHVPDEGYRIIPVQDSGYILLATTGYGGGRPWVLRLNNNLDTLWTNTLTKITPQGYSAYVLGGPRATASYTNGKYLLFGDNIQSNTGSGRDFRIVTLDTSGVITWAKYYTIIGSQNMNDAIATIDNRVAFCGESYSSTTVRDIFIIIDTLTMPPNDITISPNPDTLICVGDSILLTAPYNDSYSYKWHKDTLLFNVDTNFIWVSDTGKYWLEIESMGYAATQQDTLSLDYHQKQILDLGSDTAICNSQIVVLNGDSTFKSWLWSTNDTTVLLIIDGSVSSFGTHEYSLIATDTNSCISKDTISVTINNCTGIKDINNLKYIAYPNPVTDYFNLSFSQKTTRAISFEIYDVNGKRVRMFTLPANSKNYRIPTQDLPSGIWIYQLTMDSKIIAKGKIIKVK